MGHCPMRRKNARKVMKGFRLLSNRRLEPMRESVTPQNVGKNLGFRFSKLLEKGGGLLDLARQVILIGV